MTNPRDELKAWLKTMEACDRAAARFPQEQFAKAAQHCLAEAKKQIERLVDPVKGLRAWDEDQPKVTVKPKKR